MDIANIGIIGIVAIWIRLIGMREMRVDGLESLVENLPDIGHAVGMLNVGKAHLHLNWLTVPEIEKLSIRIRVRIGIRSIGIGAVGSIRIVIHCIIRSIGTCIRWRGIVLFRFENLNAALHCEHGMTHKQTFWSEDR